MKVEQYKKRDIGGRGKPNQTKPLFIDIVHHTYYKFV